MVKRIRKRTSAIGWYVFAGVVVLILGRLAYGYLIADPLAAPSYLPDGKYRVEKVVDSVTFVVRSDEEGGKSFRLRLAGVKMRESTDGWAKEQAENLTRTFIHRDYQWEGGAGHQGVDPVVELQFDRTYLSEDGTALAYLLVDGEILNVQLCKAGLVVPDPITGNSSSIQRKIRLASVYAENLGLGVYTED